MARADGSVIINTKIDTKGMDSGIRDIRGKMDGLGGTLRKIGGLVAAAFAVTKIIGFSRECIELGSNLDEVQNVVDVTFGKMSGAINDFAKEAATSIGLSELAAKQYTSTIGSMYKSMGFTEEAAAGMSIEMTKLAGDMASFYNLDADTAFQKIRSGISGETEPLKQLGINLSEANLEEYRLAQGIATSYKNMDQQNKALLRYNYLLSVTSDAQGDFSRTSGSWANQLRVLKLQFDSIKSTLGAGFINLFTPVLQVINKLLQGVAKVASAFKALTELITGKKSTSGGGQNAIAETMAEAADATEDYADATDDAARATKKAAKAAESYESPLDHIHKYQKETAEADDNGGTAKPKTATGGGAMAVPQMDFGSLAQGDTVADKLSKKMESLWKTIKDGSKPAIDALKRLWSQGLSQLKKFAWQSLKDFYNHFLVPVGKWVLGTGIPRLVDAFNNGLMKINWQKINDGLVKFWDALAPFAQIVGEGILWFYENVLIPLGTWTMNEVVPRFLETFATVLEIATTVIKAAQPGWQWFWDNILFPVASWTGGVFLKIWDGINGALKKFSDWCRTNPQVIENITTFVIAFFTALAGISVVKSVLDMIAKVQAFIKIAKLIGITLNPTTAIIAGLIALGVLLWKNWDVVWAKCKEIWSAIAKWLSETIDNIKQFWAEKWDAIHTYVVEKWNAMKEKAKTSFNAIKESAAAAWSGIKAKASVVWGTIKQSLSDTWDAIKNKASGVWATIKTTAGTAWDNIKATLSGKWSALKQKASDTFSGIKTIAENAWKGMGEAGKKSWETIKSKITSVFSSIGNAAKSMKKTIQNAFTTAFQGLVNLVKTPINSIIGVINGLISGIVSGINGVIGVLNRFKFSVPSWVPRIGGKRMGFNIPTIQSYPQIPYLAQGAVIPPNAPFAAVLGDQRNGNNIEMPENLLRKIVREESGNGKYEFIAQINRRVLFDEMLTEAKLRRGASGKNPFALA